MSILSKIRIFGVLFVMTSANLFADPSTNPVEVKLTPKVRVTSIANVASISLESIRPYLKPGLILDDKKQFTDAPYVFSTDGDSIDSGLNLTLYVRGLTHAEENNYTVYAPGDLLRHPITGEVLGFEAIAIADTRLEKTGDPALFKITKVMGNVETEMKLFPSFASVLPSSYQFRPARQGLNEGYILATREGVGEIGVNYIVTISLGQRDGVEEGNYFEIYQTGSAVIDSRAKTVRQETIQLPDKRIGRLVVFQVYEKASIALVVESKAIIHLLDKVKSP